MNGADKTDIDVAAILGLDEDRFSAYRVVTTHPPSRSRHLVIWACSVVVLMLVAASGISTLRINRAASRHPGPSAESLGAYVFTLAPPAPLLPEPAQTAAAVSTPIKPPRFRSPHSRDVRVARADVGGQYRAREEARHVWRVAGPSSSADRAPPEQTAFRSASSLNPGQATLAQASSPQSRRLERAERVEAIDAISLLRQK